MRMARYPRMLVTLYQPRFSPNRSWAATLSLLSPISVPSGPTAATSTVLRSTMSSKNRPKQTADVMNFFFIVSSHSAEALFYSMRCPYTILLRQKKASPYRAMIMRVGLTSSTLRNPSLS